MAGGQAAAVPRAGGRVGAVARGGVVPVPLGGHGVGEQGRRGDLAAPPAQRPRPRVRADDRQAQGEVPADGVGVAGVRGRLAAGAVQGDRPDQAAGGGAGADRPDALLGRRPAVLLLGLHADGGDLRRGTGRGRPDAGGRQAGEGDRLRAGQAALAAAGRLERAAGPGVGRRRLDAQAGREVLPDVRGGGDGEPDVRDGLRRRQVAAGAVRAAEEQPGPANDDRAGHRDGPRVRGGGPAQLAVGVLHGAGRGGARVRAAAGDGPGVHRGGRGAARGRGQLAARGGCRRRRRGRSRRGGCR